MVKCFNKFLQMANVKANLLFQALRRGRRTDWVLQPPSAGFISSCADIAQMWIWTFLLHMGRTDASVVTYLQNYCSLCSPGLMQPALLVNSQNPWPDSDLIQCKSEQCHWCQLSCSRMELLWNCILPVEYSRNITFIAWVWSEGGKSFPEHTNTEFVLSYTLV